MLEQYQDILTIEELCEILKIGRNRAYELLDTGQIKGFRLGRPWKIPKLSVEHYLKNRLESYYEQAKPSSMPGLLDCLWELRMK